MDLEQKKYCYLDEFKVIKTLGAGYHAQVQLGMDDNGNLYAMKRYKKETANLATLQHELGVMKVLQHQNLVRLIDVRENATYKKEDQSTSSCFAIILEYVGGGQLFDFVAETGKFSQKVSRTYFHQMMNGLHYMHSKGYAHRDIKPENILLGTDFVLKLADFGFSCLLKGKDGSYILHTKLGTQGYMAPEIPTKNYDGAKTDIFAAGVILFIMYAGNPPFEKAAINDPYYKLIKQKNYATFWKAHSRRRPANYFSDAFKDIFVRMVAYNPNERPQMTEIAQHPWVNSQVCSQNEIKLEFDSRLQKLSSVLEQRRQQQEAQKIKNMQYVQSRGEDMTLQTTPFLQLYQSEQVNERKIGHLEPITADDFVVDENLVYVVTIIKDFLANSKVPLEDENEVIGVEVRALRPIEVHDNGNDQMSAKYELHYEVEGAEFTETCEINLKIGTDKNDKITVVIAPVSGNRLYFKKIAKQIKRLFTYCKA